MKMLVSFNPYTNQFHYDSIEKEIETNLENIKEFGDKIHKIPQVWLTVGLADSAEGCAKIIKELSPIIKTDSTPVEKWLEENNFTLQ